MEINVTNPASAHEVLTNTCTFKEEYAYISRRLPWMTRVMKGLTGIPAESFKLPQFADLFRKIGQYHLQKHNVIFFDDDDSHFIKTSAQVADEIEVISKAEEYTLKDGTMVNLYKDFIKVLLPDYETTDIPLGTVINDICTDALHFEIACAYLSIHRHLRTHADFWKKYVTEGLDDE